MEEAYAKEHEEMKDMAIVILKRIRKVRLLQKLISNRMTLGLCIFSISIHVLEKLF